VAAVGSFKKNICRWDNPKGYPSEEILVEFFGKYSHFKKDTSNQWNLRRKLSEEDTATATASSKTSWTTAGIRLLASNQGFMELRIIILLVVTQYM